MMHLVTPADRDAAMALRDALADISGFWHRLDDEGPLCQAIARHRIEAEQRLIHQAYPAAQNPCALFGGAKPDAPALIAATGGGLTGQRLLPMIVVAAP